MVKAVNILKKQQMLHPKRQIRAQSSWIDGTELKLD